MIKVAFGRNYSKISFNLWILCNMNIYYTPNQSIRNSLKMLHFHWLRSLIYAEISGIPGLVVAELPGKIKLLVNDWQKRLILANLCTWRQVSIVLTNGNPIICIDLEHRPGFEFRISHWFIYTFLLRLARPNRSKL